MPPVAAVSSIIALIEYYTASWVGYSSVVRVSASYSIENHRGEGSGEGGRIRSHATTVSRLNYALPQSLGPTEKLF